MRFTRFFAKRYLPAHQEWTPSDEAALREWVGTEGYFAVLKFIGNRAADREAEGVTSRDVYKLERMEELQDLAREIELMQESEEEKPKQRPATRLEDFQP